MSKSPINIIFSIPKHQKYDSGYHTLSVVLEKEIWEFLHFACKSIINKANKSKIKAHNWVAQIIPRWCFQKKIVQMNCLSRSYFPSSDLAFTVAMKKETEAVRSSWSVTTCTWSFVAWWVLLCKCPLPLSLPLLLFATCAFTPLPARLRTHHHPFRERSIFSVCHKYKLFLRDYMAKKSPKLYCRSFPDTLWGGFG